MKYLPAFSLLFGLSLLGCSKESAAPAAKPAAPHIVDIRITGNCPASLGPVVEASTLDSTGVVARLISDTFPAMPYTRTVTTVDLGRKGTARAHLTMVYATTPQAPGSSYLQAEFLVGGVVKKTLRLDNSAQSASSQHPEIGISYTYADLIR